MFKKGLILIGRCRIERMICVGSLNYASEDKEEEEEERKEKDKKQEDEDCG